ncbi:unnamed protein product, partial [Mesorhabditis belari]|uniref:Uncharacterized protein n=1 Tax=Mesorhabditis belari TaxID=2138241 RepID=A0AAF3F7U7_9BILA
MLQMLSSSAVYFYSYLVSSALNILALFVFGFWLANAFYGFLVSLNLILTTLGQGLILVFFLRKRTSKAQHTKAALSNNSETSFTIQSTALTTQKTRSRATNSTITTRRY